MVPVWIPIIIRHLIFRVPKKDQTFGDHPYVVGEHKARPNQWSLAVEYRIRGLIEGFRV